MGLRVILREIMLLAYIDEIGATGAFVNHDQEKYSDSPAFGYGGFILPVENVRVVTRVNTVIGKEVL